MQSYNDLDAQLPKVLSEKFNKFVVKKFKPPLWLAARTGNRSMTWTDGEPFKFS